MNLLGLLMQGYLSKQLTHRRLDRKTRRMRGSIGVTAGSMAITMTFTPEAILISKGIQPKTRARVSGTMQEMLGMITHGGLISSAIAVLEGRLAIRGNPFALLPLIGLMTKKVDLPATNSNTDPR